MTAAALERGEDSPALVVEDLHVARRGWPAPVALPALRLAPGGAAALLGSSGCGKTSLLWGILGLLEPDAEVEGRVWIAGRPRLAGGAAEQRRLLRDEVALVLQDARAALDPLARLGEQLGVAANADEVAVAEALGELGIETPRALLQRYPHQVSGGQAQRCLLAVALLRRPRLLVADEPNASLDEERSADVVRALRLLRGQAGTAVLMATHDHALVEALEAEPLVQGPDGSFRAARPEVPPWPEWSRGAAGGEAVLACRDVGVRAGESWLVRGASLELRRREVVALLGPSGAGKTTLAKVLAGHLRPSTGSVTRPPRRTAVQMLFQDAHASLTPGRAVGALVREVAVRGFAAGAVAAELGLTPALLACSREALSGGERRRAALLRALAVEPEVLILDEPTASLDRATAVPVVETLLAAQHARGLAALLVTHDRDLAAAVADRVLVMEAGRLAQETETR